MRNSVRTAVYIVIGRINMIDTILRVLQSDIGVCITSIISSIFMSSILLAAIGIHAWILIVRLLDYKRMK